MEYKKQQAFGRLKLANTVITVMAILAVLACLVIASMRSTDASERLSALNAKVSEAMPMPQQPDPIAMDGDIPEYDFYEDILWTTESAYVDAYNHYMHGYASAESLGDENIKEAFKKTVVDEGNKEAAELINGLKSLIPNLKQKDPLPRLEATSFNDGVMMLAEITDLTDAYGSAGTRAVRDELESRMSMQMPVTMIIVIIGVFFVYVIVSNLIGTKMQKLLLEQRRYRHSTVDDENGQNNGKNA